MNIYIINNRQNGSERAKLRPQFKGQSADGPVEATATPQGEATPTPTGRPAHYSEEHREKV